MTGSGRKETWLDGLGEWSWPGPPAAAVELAPAAWVPAVPLHIEAPLVRSPRERRRLPRRLRLARLVALLAVGGATVAVSSEIAVRAPAAGPVGIHIDRVPLRDPFTAPSAAARSGPAFDVLAPPPVPRTVGTDRAGSTIAAVSFHSRALGWRDTYLVYLPPGYRAAPRRRYPVLYLLHGDREPAASFLRLGLQPTLDHLIRSRAIAPLIAVMLQAGGLPNNWRNTSGPRYNSYVGEVQRETDRVLRTIASRGSRAIAGYSMGGFGAMNIALAQLRSYSVVESWEGYFDNLAGELAADRRLFARLPLHAFVWGGRQDAIDHAAPRTRRGRRRCAPPGRTHAAPSTPVGTHSRRWRRISTRCSPTPGASCEADRVGDDPRVVEGERRKRIERMPARLARVVAAAGRQLGAGQHHVHDRHRRAARIAPGSVVDAEQLEAHGAHAGFLGELARRALGHALRTLDEAARQRPRARKRIMGAPHEEDAARRVPGDRRDVDGQRGPAHARP